jgi:hypothetical protein
VPDDLLCAVLTITYVVVGADRAKRVLPLPLRAGLEQDRSSGSNDVIS